MADRFAFPGDSKSSNGMTLRDYFAAQAMAGLVAGYDGSVSSDSVVPIVSKAYAIADAMVKASGTHN